jgi:hypothetical protein
MAFIPLNGPGAHGALSVTTTPQLIKVGASNLDQRTIITIQPIDGDVYFGYDNSVSSTTGTLVMEGQFFPLEATHKLDVWIVCATGTIDVRITEVS